MKIRFLIIALSFLCLQCENNRIDRPSKPDKLLSEDKMVEVIYDMTVVSAAKGLNRRIIENKGIYPEEFVYRKHGIDSIIFSESNEYYSYDIKQYERIYQRVKEKLQADKARFTKMVESDRNRKDSISDLNRTRRDSIIKATNERVNLNP